MPDWLTPLLSVGGTIALGLLTWAASRRTADRERIQKLERRLDDVEARDLRWQNYAVELRGHIFAGKGPPPPPFPDDLTKDSR